MFMKTERVFYLGTNEDSIRCLQDMASGGAGIMQVHCGGMLECLEHLVENKADVLLLSAAAAGEELARMVNIIRRIRGDTRIVLIGGSKGDAYEVLRLGLDGFLLEPLSRQDIEGLLFGSDSRGAYMPLGKWAAQPVRMCTMPSFDMHIRGEPVIFNRKKAKELMAFLVNMDGASVDGDVITRAMWPDKPPDPKQKNSCRVLVHTLKSFLESIGLKDLLVAKNGQYYLNRKFYTSDVDELLKGDRQRLVQFDGRYMDGYAWAESRRKYLRKVVNSG